MLYCYTFQYYKKYQKIHKLAQVHHKDNEINFMFMVLSQSVN